ncbi:MAG: M61 family metallopeptidase [Vicinamibacterales bacterium]
MTRTALSLAVCALLMAMTHAGSVGAQAPEPIRYTLRFPAPHTHYVEVEATYPTGGRPQVELFMPVWTPGSYLVREYERHVEALEATSADGSARDAVKTRKNRWRVDTGGQPSVTVRYRVYGREMTVRNNWIEAGFAMINGAPTYLTLLEATKRPHLVHVELPAAWRTISTALAPVAGEAATFRADDFDMLVDSPMVIGNSVVREFEVSGKTHHMVFEGDTRFIDADQAAADAQKIVTEEGKVFGRYDYPWYYFLTLVTESGGGLEHKNSTMLMTNRYTTRTARGRHGWNGLVAHEYFHNWNVKRLRPVELGPFDYENEVHTRSLWIAEGFTDYYANVILRRAGLSDSQQLLDDLSDQIQAVQTTPGRLVTPVAQASWDTWIKQYRPDENTGNTTINYYPKGAVIAFLLDAKIRRATGGQKSLDDAMRLAYERYSGEKGYTPEQFYQTMSEVAGMDLSSWFHEVAETSDELDYTEALDWYGLRFRPVDPAAGGAWMGMSTRDANGRLVVTRVPRGTPAFEAGVNVEDEIVAIDEVRVGPDTLASRLQQYRPGDDIALTVGRRDRLTALSMTLGAEPPRRWRLEVSPTATAEQKAHLEALGASR